MQVAEGTAAPVDCSAVIAVFGSCSGNNPAGIYLQLEPPIAGEYVDPCYNSKHDCSGRTPNAFTQTVTLADNTQATVNPFYRLDSNQALITIINLPPLAAYLGYQSYVFSRYIGLGILCPPFSIYPDPCRSATNASISNSINNVTIQNQAHLGLGSGGTVAIVTTPSSTLNSKLTSAWKAINGADPSLLFSEPLGTSFNAGIYSSSAQSGLSTGNDEMVTLARLALPQDQTATTTWVNGILQNVRVYRVTLPGANTRFASATLATKHYTYDERQYQSALNELSNDIKSWLATVNKSNVSSNLIVQSSNFSNSGTATSGAIGPICLGPLLKGCWADAQDTDTYRTAVVGTLTHTAAVVGVDSTKTGNASYISIGVYRNDTQEGVAALSEVNAAQVGFDNGGLSGSASSLVNALYASKLISAPSATLTAALPYLYVALVSRDCASGSNPLPFFCGTNYTYYLDGQTVPAQTGISLTHRAYVHPGDTNGPNPYYLLSPVVLN
jgi:hypothetical protein